ncbi:MAG: PASTA domain-containing protein [Treponema sp.]
MDIKTFLTNANTTAERAKKGGTPREDIHAAYETLKPNGKPLAFTALAAFLVMLFFALTAFFINVRGAEEVLVPDVRGKDLSGALIEMQEKELYPKIMLRYSETPGDEGTVLDQTPQAGSIVKGYSRVSLVVSRGVVVDRVESYVGMNIDELKLKLSALFAGSSRPLITIKEPQYKSDPAPAGTILAQDPPANTDISQPVALSLVVSLGSAYETTKVPELVGRNVSEVLKTVSQTRLIFDFTSHIAERGEAAGVVSSQENFNTDFIKNYSRVRVDMAFPAASNSGAVYGIFSAQLADYPYPVPMRLDAAGADGTVRTLVKFQHTGGALTLPYSAAKETTLILYAVDKEVTRMTVR